MPEHVPGRPSLACPGPESVTTARARAVALTPDHADADAAGSVDAIVDDGGATLCVRIKLDEHTQATATLPKLDLAWLDLRVGDVVAVRRIGLSRAALRSAVSPKPTGIPQAQCEFLSSRFATATACS